MIAHDVLSYVCAKDLGFCEDYIEITKNTYSNYDNDVYNREYSIEMREGKRPTIHSQDQWFDEDEYYADYVRYNNPVEGRVKAIEVLSLYSVEPDWGMDEGMKLSPLQILTGGSLGYRHLRYGLFFFRAGIAHKRALVFTRLAKRAFEKKDTYWGIRFSARAVHYIEDILTPFHTKPFPEWFFFERLFHIKDLYFITQNYHLNFERYIAYQLWHGKSPFIEEIRESEPVVIYSLKRDLLKASRRARTIFYPIFSECRSLWRDTMEKGSVRFSKRDVMEIEPSARLIEYTKKWLYLASGIVKGYILYYIIPFVEVQR